MKKAIINKALEQKRTIEDYFNSGLTFIANSQNPKTNEKKSMAEALLTQFFLEQETYEDTYVNPIVNHLRTELLKLQDFMITESDSIIHNNINNITTTTRNSLTLDSIISENIADFIVSLK